jgi:hypothetical protein
MPIRWVAKNPVHNPGSLNFNSGTDQGTAGACCTFDAANGKVVLYNTAGETWTWDGSDWTQLAPAHSPTPARYGACMAYLPGTGVIMFGGRQTADRLTDYAETWLWDGTDWTQLAPAHSPSAGPFAAMTYYASGGKLILYGGRGGSLATWTYDGSDWTDVTPGTVKPNVAMNNPVMVHDAAGNARLIGAAGGSTNRVWIWNGSTWVDQGTIAATSVSMASQAGAFSTSMNRSVFIMRPEAPAGTRLTWFETATSYAAGNAQTDHPGVPDQQNVNQLVAQTLNGNVIFVYSDKVTPAIRNTFELVASGGFSAQIL